MARQPLLEQFDTREHCSPAVFRWGFLKLRAPRAVPATVKYYIESPDIVGFSVFGAFDEPPGLSLYYAKMYRLPAGAAELEKNVAFFRADEKNFKLPGGGTWEPSMLAPPGVPAAWKHDYFLVRGTGRAVFHVYRGETRALLVRCLADNEDIREHPLFVWANANLEFDEPAWHTKPPEPGARDPSRPPPGKDEPLRPDQLEEVRAGVARAHQHLALPPDAAPAAAQRAIFDAVRAIVTSRKRPRPQELTDLAVALGMLWGQTVCDALGWQWCNVRYADGGEVTFATASPTRAHVIAPGALLYRQFTQRGPRPNVTTLLFFNMLKAGKLPRAAPGAYRMLE
jgi:hypothetical protein